MKRTHSINVICFIMFFLVLSTNVQIFASTVNNAASISLNKTSDVLTVGQTDTLVATINSAAAAGEVVTWVSSNSSIVSVFNGVVMAVHSGTAVITAITTSGTASCVVTVTSPVTVVSLNKTSDVLTVGGTDILVATVNQVTGSTTTTISQSVTWTSSNPAVVQVGNGYIYAAGSGTAVITASTAGGSNTASCYVTVNATNPLVEIDLNKKADVLTVGGTDTLTASVISTSTANPVVTWVSSNPSVVNVFGGVLIAESPGTAVITATTADGSDSATCNVTVNNLDSTTTQAQTISLNKTLDVLAVGGTDTLVSTVNPTATASQAVTWVSSNPNVATVANGVVTAVSTGTAVIMVTTADGSINATCTVTVNNAPLSSVKTTRLGGADRYGTSAAISQAGWKGTSSYAVLASGNDFPDGLGSAVLAKKYNAPILLTDKDVIPESVLNEIKRLQVNHIFITGGTGVVSQAVENQLNAMGITTERFGGKDRYETSIKIAEKLGAETGEIIVTNGYQWADALSASAIAAKQGIPIILTDKDVLPDSVNTFISKNKFSKTYILGDTDLISTAVANKFPNSQKIVGSTEYERNINIIKTFESDIDFSNICIASGRDFPDSISGSAFAAMNSSAIVLVDDSDLQNVTTQYINEKLTQINNVYIFGLQGAVNDNVIQKLLNKNS
ncbi:cell wall-binding repeat-containing protein [Clostridium sp. WILCCON 0269]|uniref:Cell wall-binding repeat-containing protein n=1 Tax=Candidatus Clostridium eludens TaxID=3381663 RepID=A0ABW8SEM7_9CLOT